MPSCSNCEKAGLPCTTTNRITKQPEVRGQTSSLQHENESLKQENVRLRQLISSMGGNPGPESFPQHVSQPPVSHGIQQYNSTCPANDAFANRPEPLAQPFGSDYFGIASSPFKGNKLNLLGVTLDIGDFTASDMVEPDLMSTQTNPVYNKSYNSFLASVYGVQKKQDRPELPGREESFRYAEWYFMVINVYVPIMHKPTFMALVRHPRRVRSLFAN